MAELAGVVGPGLDSPRGEAGARRTAKLDDELKNNCLKN
jgi:hypothetical protein